MAGHQWLKRSPRFSLREVIVTGNQRLSADEIAARAGIAAGDNLFDVDLSGARDALEEHPWVAEARVFRRLPDRIQIEVEERRAAALVDLGGLYLADPDGTVFKRVNLDTSEASGLPVVTGIGRREYVGQPAAARERIQRAVAVAKLYRQVAARPAIGEVHIDGWRGLSLYTYEGQPRSAWAAARSPRSRRDFDSSTTAWASLSPAERLQVRDIHLDRDSNPDRMTVAFARAE